MDTLSHGLWGSITVGRKNKKEFRSAFAWGIMPDILSFGILTVASVLGFSNRPNRSKPSPDMIPDYVHMMYNITHSAVIWAIVFVVLWIIFRRPIKTSFAWLFHILLDMPTHSILFFPTPFLWPISNFVIDGIPRSTPWILISNRSLIILSYLVFWLIKRKIINLNFFKKSKSESKSL